MERNEYTGEKGINIRKKKSMDNDILNHLASCFDSSYKENTTSPVKRRTCDTAQHELEKISMRFGTPNSIIDKINCISPRRTTCDKNKNVSDSPAFVWIDSSQSKRIKHFGQTPVSIFQDSNEKLSEIKQNKTDFYDFTARNLMVEKTEFFLADLDSNHMNLNIFETYPFFAGNQEKNALVLPATYERSEKIERTLFAKQPRAKAEFGKCNCQSSQCLKMYCDCLKRGDFCVGCNCKGCENTEQSTLRKQKIEEMLEKTKKTSISELFQTESDLKAKIIKNGCNCRKNSCKKNYCECHQFGLTCSSNCRCTDCHNGKKELFEA